MLDLPRVILLDWSLGVFDVLAYLDRHGLDRVVALVLVDESPKIVKSSAEDWGEGDADEIAALIETVGGSGYLPFFREYMAEGFDGEAPPALLDRMTETAAALPAGRAAALLRDAAQRDFSILSKHAARELPVLQIIREDWAIAARGLWQGAARREWPAPLPRVATRLRLRGGGAVELTALPKHANMRMPVQGQTHSYSDDGYSG